MNGLSTFPRGILLPSHLELWFQAVGPSVFLLYLQPPGFSSVGDPHTHFVAHINDPLLDMAKAGQLVLLFLLGSSFTAPLRSNATTFPSSGNSDVVLVTVPWVTY